jgi:hypothetical protein
MREAATISELPNAPAVYALYGGRGQGLHAAYVGVAEALHRRIRQHLVTHDSSVTTGASVASLNPNLVTEVRWWEHPAFSERPRLEAAELVAFKVLDPVLRSRGVVQDTVNKILAEQNFESEMEALFAGDPIGRLSIPTLQDALERIEALEHQLAALEKKLSGR